MKRVVLAIPPSIPRSIAESFEPATLRVQTVEVELDKELAIAATHRALNSEYLENRRPALIVLSTPHFLALDRPTLFMDIPVMCKRDAYGVTVICTADDEVNAFLKYHA